MIVGISGAQGGGKSSLLNELKSRGYQVDNFRVSRAVQTALGWDALDRVMDSPETMMAFQEEVFNQKLTNDSAFTESEDWVLTERTFADAYAYAATWTYKFIDDGRLDLDAGLNWLASYGTKCAAAQVKTYRAAILLPLMDHVVFDQDPHRAKQEDASAVYEMIDEFCVRCSYPRTEGRSVYRFCITEKTTEGRASQVEKFIERLQAS
jgi:predicted ATPase